MRSIPMLIGAVALALAAAAQAQPPRVTVEVGPKLAARAQYLGARELDELRGDLGREVERALANSPNAPTQVRLIIEDAQNNRPTFEQLGRTPGLSLRSIGVGGARISGTVTLRDGSVRPIRYQWYETDISQERGVSTWSDAEHAFSWLAGDLARGRTPDAYRGPGPSDHGGEFGYPFNR